MEIIKTDIEGLLIIKPRVFVDERGYFFESWSKESFCAFKWYRHKLYKTINHFHQKVLLEDYIFKIHHLNKEN